MNSQEIITLIREGKHSLALELLYQNYPAVRKLVCSKGGSEEDAKDVFQEGLIVLCENASKSEFQLTCAVGTYLYSVCRFIWKNKLRQRKQHVKLPDYHTVAASEQHVQHYLEEEARYGFMERILQNLGQKCLHLLQRYYFQKQSMDTIAQQLGYSSGKVARNQKYKCLERARKMVREYHVEHDLNTDRQNLPL